MVGAAVRADHDAATGEALADVVVGVALQAEGDALRHEGAEGLAGAADEGQVDGVVGQARATELLGDVVAEHGADGPVDVADRDLGADRLGRLGGLGVQRVGGELDQLVVEGLLQTVVLLDQGVADRALGQLRHVEERLQVEALRLPVRDGLGGVEELGVADGLLDRAEAQLGEDLAHLLRDVLEEVDDELGLAGEAVAQDRVLGGDADWAGVQVADAHHDAAGDDERRGRETELLGAEQRGDDHVAAGLELAVGLDDDPVAQPIEQQGLLGLGEAELPGAARVLERGERGGARSAVVAGDQDDVRVGLGDTRGDRAHADLGDQLHVDAGDRVGVLEVVDQLSQVLDGVDVVVRRRGDQADARGGVPGLGDPRVHLVAGQLAALAGLGALRHLDLDVVRVDQVLRGHAEAAGGDLLDGRAPRRVVQAVRVLAALTGVGLGAQLVHSDGEGLVRLLGDGAVRHGAGGEALDDVGDRLDLVDGDGFAVRGEAEQAAERHQALGLLVHPGRVLLEDVVPAVAGGVLEAEDRLRVEQVRLALAAPLVLAADLQRAVRGGDAGDGVRLGVARGHLLGDDVQAGAADLGGGAVEVGLDELVVEADGLEDLGAAVGGDGGDAHLGHDLQDALAERVDQVLDGLLRLQAGQEGTGAQQVLDGLHGEVRVDRGRSVADEQGDVVDLADVTGLDQQADLGALLGGDEVVVHGGGEQQRRDRCVLGVRVAVREDDQAGAVGDGRVGLGADLLDPGGQGLAAAGDPVEAGERGGLHAGHVAVGVDVDELGQLVVVDHREGQGDAAAGRGGRLQQVALRAERGQQRGDELLADGVQRRVGDLREELGEVVEEQPGALGQGRDRGVRTHGAERLAGGTGHRREDDAQLFLGVAEGLLAAGDRGVGVHDVLALGQVRQLDLAGLQPLRVRGGGGQLVLDLVVLDDPLLGGVDEEHLAGLQAALADDLGRVDVEHADLGAEDDEAVVGDPVAAGAQTVAVEDRTDLGAVGEGDAGRAVPGLHLRGVVLVERAAGRVHGGVVLPRLRDHHQHAVREGAAAEVEQLQDLVEGGRVGGVRGADREDPVQGALTEGGGDQLGLAGLHPVPVALDRVDLAVVRDEAVRVGERPRREGVRGEARVDQGDGRGEAAVGEVGEEGLQLAGGQHALVDDGAGGERREVDTGLALGALAQHEGLAVQLDARAAVAHEQLREGGHGGAGAVAEQVRGDRDLAPAEDREVLLGGDGLDLLHGDGLCGAVGGEEGDTDGVAAGRGELEAGHLAQERVGDLAEDSGAVARVRLGAGRAAVLEVPQYGQGLLNKCVGGLAGEVRHESDATGVLLVARVVHALLGGATVHGRPGGGAGAGRGVRGCGTHRLSRRRRGICA